jgi:hypothetical protein
MGTKHETSLNALCNPAEFGDVIIMDDGSEWKIGQDLTYWTITPPADSSLPVFKHWGQMDLLRALAHINAERSKVAE